jgi:hypothetical protein
MTNHDKEFGDWIRKANTFVSHTIVWNNSATTGAYTVAFKDKKWDPLFIGDLPQLAEDLGIFDKMYPSTDAVPVLKEVQPETVFESRVYTYIKYSLQQRSWFIVIDRKPIAIGSEDAGQFLNAGLEFQR